MSAGTPIGIFDSGLGGLSIAREIRARLRREDLLYIADSAYVPYGGRSLEEIRARSIAVVRVLVEAGTKAVVVACNTASGAALEVLRETFDLPIIGLEPAIKPAASSSRVGRIAVLATPATLQTERFHRLVDAHGAGVDVVKIACPGFVELVEAGELSGERTLATIRDTLAPATREGVDHIVLGCTHYAFLRAAIAEVLGKGVEILDSGVAVARQVERVLAERDLLRSAGEGRMRVLTTGRPADLAPIVARLWGEPLEIDAVSA
jgi:glutamate racemase